MSVKTNIGPKRLVVGAHYGLTEWLLQRVTAVIMAVYTLLLLVVYFIFGNPSYEGWSSLFANQFMKIPLITKRWGLSDLQVILAFILHIICQQSREV